MQNFPLDKKRIIFLITGIITMLIGFFVMTLDKSEFGFGFLGITLGPILVLIGIVLPVLSLFNFSKNDK
jgi:hypothetical protein